MKRSPILFCSFLEAVNNVWFLFTRTQTHKTLFVKTVFDLTIILDCQSVSNVLHSLLLFRSLSFSLWMFIARINCVCTRSFFYFLSHFLSTPIRYHRLYRSIYAQASMERVLIFFIELSVCDKECGQRFRSNIFRNYFIELIERGRFPTSYRHLLEYSNEIWAVSGLQVSLRLFYSNSTTIHWIEE